MTRTAATDVTAAAATAAPPRPVSIWMGATGIWLALFFTVTILASLLLMPFLSGAMSFTTFACTLGILYALGLVFFLISMATSGKSFTGLLRALPGPVYWMVVLAWLPVTVIVALPFVPAHTAGWDDDDDWTSPRWRAMGAHPRPGRIGGFGKF